MLPFQVEIYTEEKKVQLAVFLHEQVILEIRY
jgi:hypothetical protein